MFLHSAALKGSKTRLGLQSRFGDKSLGITARYFFCAISREVLMGDRSYLANGVAHSAITVFAEKLLMR